MPARINRETLLGVIVPLAVYALLFGSGGRTPLLFALAWLWILIGPWPEKPRWTSLKQEQGIISPALYRLITIISICLFLLVCVLGKLVGNYILWLKVIYYVAYTSRLALFLGSPLMYDGYRLKTMWISAWAMGACVPLVWWSAGISPHLAYLLLLLVGWSATVTLFLSFIKRSSSHWLIMALLHLGPFLPLALAWPDIASWILIPILCLLFLVRWLHKGIARPAVPAGEERGVLWVPLWLFRSAFICWWYLGCALAVSLAWWMPEPGLYFEHNAWLKAVGLGLFVLVCLGLLIEYLMPLLGRPEPQGHWRRDQSWGPILSALALMMVFTPALLLPRHETPYDFSADKPRAVLLDEPMVLGLSQQEINLPLPEDVSEIKRVYIISRLVNGQNLVQAQPVAVLAVMGETGLPDIYYLRAGIDTAEENLEQSQVMIKTRHTAAESADETVVFSSDGQAYYQKSYLGGFFLDKAPQDLNSISLHYMPSINAESQGPAPYLVVEKVMVE